MSRACVSHQLPPPQALAERQPDPRLVESVDALAQPDDRSCPCERALVLGLQRGPTVYSKRAGRGGSELFVEPSLGGVEVAQLLRAEPDRRPHPYVVRSVYFILLVPREKVALSGEFVWALETDVKRVVCELHDHGADGWDAQLVRDGEFPANRRFDTRAQALAHADAMRLLLEGVGWKLVAA